MCEARADPGSKLTIWHPITLVWSKLPIPKVRFFIPASAIKVPKA